MVDACAMPGVRHLVPKLERELEMALGGGRSRRIGGGPSCSHRGRERAREIVRGEPVMREHRARIQIRAGKIGPVLDRLRVRLVKLGPLTREQIVVDRRPGQRMTEAVSATGSIDYEQLLPDCLPQRTVQLGVGQPGDDREQTIRDPACRG